MKKGAYGIVKVFLSHNVRLNEEILNFRDGEHVSENSQWNEIHLARPGSLQYDFEVINGVTVCKTTLTFNSVCDLYNDGENAFFLAQDVFGNKHLIGLGENYDTIPKIDTTDAINDTAAEGSRQTVKVTWSNLCGRVYAE